MRTPESKSSPFDQFGETIYKLNNITKQLNEVKFVQPKNVTHLQMKNQRDIDDLLKNNVVSRKFKTQSNYKAEHMKYIY